jgi:8-amino-7-oxononanoate synthase
MSRRAQSLENASGSGLAGALDRLRRAGLYRRRRLLTGPQGPRPLIDGRRVTSFCSNDYLGLASHPAVVAALKRGADDYGAGSGAAHLITGHSVAHQALEEELAEFVGRPRALLFSTGYMANLGVIAALAGRGDRIFEDRLNHASLIDGALLSRARLRRYPHADAQGLVRLLGGERASIIASDGVFSMDGDLAPLPALAEAARGAGAWLLVDDAHGLGVLGEHGRGCLERFGLAGDAVPILVGTLGKAFGTFGAFVAGSEALVETLIQHARSYIYTTAPPPALAEATRTSLGIARRESWRRRWLAELIDYFRREASTLDLPLMASSTPIQPLVAGSVERVLAWSRYLEERGILVGAIRPPTVPHGSARLRITFSAAHRREDLDRLLEALSGLPDRARVGAWG